MRHAPVTFIRHEPPSANASPSPLTLPSKEFGDNSSIYFRNPFPDREFRTEATADKKQVRICTSQEIEEKDEYGEPLVEPLVPMKDKVNSELTVEVTPAGPNEFEFDQSGS